MSYEIPRAVRFWCTENDDTKWCVAYMARSPIGDYVLLTPANRWALDRFHVFATAETEAALAEAVHQRLAKSGPWKT